MPRKRREEEGIHGKQAKSLDSCFANFWSDLPTGCCFYLPKYQAQICHWRIIENLFWSWIEPLSYAHGQKNLISLERLWAFLFSSCYPLFTKFKRLKQTNIWKWNKPPISTGTKIFFPLIDSFTYNLSFVFGTLLIGRALRLKMYKYSEIIYQRVLTKNSGNILLDRICLIFSKKIQYLTSSAN